MQIVNAGLPHPILIRTQGQGIERVPVNGLFMGVDLPGAVSPGECAEITLKPGERLLLYTDGVSESAAADGSQFDDGAMAEHLATALGITVDDMVELLADTAIRYRDDGQEPDDITIVAIEVV